LEFSTAKCSIPELSFDLAFKFLCVWLGRWVLKHHYAFCLLTERTVPFQERKRPNCTKKKGPLNLTSEPKKS